MDQLTHSLLVPTAADIRESAYFAGFFDGEGHVMIREVRRDNGTNRSIKYVGLEVHVALSNLCPDPLLRARDRWAGRVYGYKRPGRDRICHRWQACGQKASAFLSDVLPFLLVKQRQAALALELQARINATRHNRLRLPSEMAERYRLRDAIKALNARKYFGPYPVAAG